jgi:hypothetical protein
LTAYSGPEAAAQDWTLKNWTLKNWTSKNQTLKAGRRGLGFEDRTAKTGRLGKISHARATSRGWLMGEI